MKIQLLILIIIVALSQAKHLETDSKSAKARDLGHLRASVTTNLRKHFTQEESNPKTETNKAANLPHQTHNKQGSTNPANIHSSKIGPQMRYILNFTESLIAPSYLSAVRRILDSENANAESDGLALKESVPVPNHEELKTSDGDLDIDLKSKSKKQKEKEKTKKEEEKLKKEEEKLKKKEAEAAAGPKKKSRVWHWIGMFFLFLFLAALLGAAGFYVHLRIKQKRLEAEMTMNPEAVLIQKVEMSSAMKEEYEKWGFEPKDQGVTMEKDITAVGEYINLKFNQPKGEFRTVFGNQDLKMQANQHCYFEIEIEDFFDNDVSIMVGIIQSNDLNELDPKKHPGLMKSGVSFSSKEGKVIRLGKVQYKYDINAMYGETLGLGFHFVDGRVWLFYNGKFLNPLIEPLTAKEKKTMSQKDIEKYNELSKDAEKKMIIMPLDRNQTYRLAVSSDGPCEVNVNLGGAPFRAQNKEIAKGVL